MSLLNDEREKYVTGGLSKLMSKALGIPNPSLPFYYAKGKLPSLTKKSAEAQLKHIKKVEKLHHKEFDRISGEGMEAKAMRNKYEPNSKEYKKYDKILKQKDNLFGELEKESDMVSFQKERLQRFIKYGKLDPDDPKNYFNEGGEVSMLEDDRKKYATGTPEEKSEEKLLGHIEEITDELREKLLNNDRKTKDFVIKEYGIDPDGLEMEIRNLQERDGMVLGGIVRALSPKAKQILRRELPKHYDSLVSKKESKYKIRSTTPDDIIKEYEQGEDIIFYTMDNGTDAAVTEKVIDSILLDFGVKTQRTKKFDPRIEDATGYSGKDYLRDKIENEESFEGLGDLLTKDKRKSKAQGGLLDDDREKYVLGGISRGISKAISKIGKGLSDESFDDFIKRKRQIELEKLSQIEKSPQKIANKKRIAKLVGSRKLTEAEKNILREELPKNYPAIYTDQEAKGRISATTADDIIREYEAGEDIIIYFGDPPDTSPDLGMNASEIDKILEKKRTKKAEGGPTHTMPDGTVMPGATHEEYENMLPDNEMEDEYLDFILDEALDSEEEDYLMEQLQSNDRLSIIFDKVVDVAQEFAGSGPVEGPGSGVSDSIPARLSDGEFVFTAKAVDEIGADNLMAMMKDAEMKADDRQGLAEGGQPEEEETVEMPVEKPASKQDIRVVKTTIDNGGKGLLDEDEISKSIKSKMMLDNRTGRHVQS